MKLVLARASVLLSLAFCNVPAPAQEAAESGIRGTGFAILERFPETMRVQVDLLAKGKDLPDALEKLKARRTRVEKQIESLGAVKESVKFSDVASDDGQTDRQRQVQAMMMQRMAQKRGKGKPEVQPAQVARVAMKLTAEWPLKSKDTTDLLLEAQKLQDAIKAADLGGAKDAQELTAEEEEENEEMQEMMAMSYDSDDRRKPGEPEFLFVAKVAPKDLQSAMGEAFRQAKEHAEQLGNAAELKIGALRSLEANSGLDYGDTEDARNYYQYQRQMASQSELREAVGARPGVLKYRVTVSARFDFAAGR